MKKISYSKIKTKNIFDRRFTGSGKTTSAIDYIHEIVEQNRLVIVLMQSYERLENNYHSQFKEPLQKHTIIYKGKTQKGMCKFSEVYKGLYDNKETPKNECDTCSDRDRCAYQNQIRDLKKFKESKQGFCILTTEKKLYSVLSEIKYLDPVIIIDDIPLSSVVTPEIEIPQSEIDALLIHLQNQKPEPTALIGLVSRLSTYSSENELDIITYIELNFEQLQREISQFSVDHTGSSKLPSHKAMSVLLNLIVNVKKGNVSSFYSEFNMLKIVTNFAKEYQPFRLCYLNATPSQKDEYCIKQLGKCKHLKAKVSGSKRYHIFQIIDSATTKQSIITSERLRSDFKALTNVINPSLRYVNQKLLLFAHREVFDEWETVGVLSEINYNKEIYFGQGTRGTNDYKDYPVSFILGTPYYPPEYFLHPAFESHWKSKAQIEKERRENPNGFLSYVERDIADDEAKINLLQMIGRNLRDSPNNPDAVKVVVVFTSVDIAKDCKKQNGGIVHKEKIRKEIPYFKGEKKSKIKGKKGDSPLFDGYTGKCQAALKSLIKKRIQKQIDQMLEDNPDESISLQVFAKELQNDMKIYSTEAIKGLIKGLYIIDTQFVEDNGHLVKKTFIVGKKEV